MMFKIKLWIIAKIGWLVYFIYKVLGLEKEYFSTICQTAVQIFCEDFISDDKFLDLSDYEAIIQIYHFSLLYCHNLFHVNEAYEDAFFKISKECIRKYKWHKNTKGL